MSSDYGYREKHSNRHTERRERCFAAALCRVWGYWSEKLQDNQRIDFIAGEKHKAPNASMWLEVKCRAERSTAYPDYILSSSKWVQGIMNAQATRSYFMFAMYWHGDGKSLYLPVDPADIPEHRLVFGGRTVQTRDKWDKEPVVHIDRSLFVDIGIPDPFTGATPEETW